jgi:hypothetical protein
VLLIGGGDEFGCRRVCGLCVYVCMYAVTRAVTQEGPGWAYMSSRVLYGYRAATVARDERNSTVQWHVRVDMVMF